MATANDVIAKANTLRDKLQRMLDNGLSGSNGEIVQGLLYALIAAIETFSNAHPGSQSSPAFPGIIDKIDDAIALATPTSIPALNDACESVFNALNG